MGVGEESSSFANAAGGAALESMAKSGAGGRVRRTREWCGQSCAFGAALSGEAGACRKIVEALGGGGGGREAAGEMPRGTRSRGGARRQT